MALADPVEGCPTPEATAPVRRAGSRSPFAQALRDGLADLAYAFEGVFESGGSMSLADRAAYGIRAASQPTTARTCAPSPACVAPASLRLRAPSAANIDTTGTSARISAVESCRTGSSQPLPAAEPVRARRVTTAANAPRRAIARPGCWLRARVRIGDALLDVLVSPGRPIASVSRWMR